MTEEVKKNDWLEEQLNPKPVENPVNDYEPTSGEGFIMIFLLAFSFLMLFFMGYGIYKLINKPVPGETSISNYGLVAYTHDNQTEDFLIYVNADGTINCTYVDGEESHTIILPAGTPVLAAQDVAPYIEVTTTPITGRYIHKKVTEVVTYRIILNSNDWSVRTAQ